jgi:hypothetical protein
VVTVRRDIDAPTEAVWKVLANGWLYPSWVVGAIRVRDVDPGWPDVGAQVHHSIGTWPLLLDDTTTVIASVPHRELVLRAHGWPAGAAEVTLVLADRIGGCEVIMAEDVVSGLGRLVPPPVRAAVIGPRNAESLRRLAYLAEGTSR